MPLGLHNTAWMDVQEQLDSARAALLFWTNNKKVKDKPCAGEMREHFADQIAIWEYVQKCMAKMPEVDTRQ